ncbi:MAG: exodeoxyribonuclease V subunit alpha [Fibrobacterota bacterium]|nr:exodeoxyribonuclease V subunit alpha [Chitinispirillaceae bacterium]
MNTIPVAPTFDFTDFDHHLADFLCKLDKEYNDIVYLSVAVLSSALRSGNICLDLNLVSSAEIALTTEQCSFSAFPDAATWITRLKQSDVCGIPGEYKPLILDTTRLYFYRRWFDEQQVAEYFLSKATTEFPSMIFEHLDLIRSFFTNNNSEIDYQYLSAILSLANKCCIINGGPGSGKTTTVVKILALHLILYPESQRIGLAAPTGKAAARLKSAIMHAVNELPCTDTIKKAIPSDAVTIHRLLSSNQKNAFLDAIGDQTHLRLPYRILVVDEASMIDLSLMGQLIKAIHPQCKLILLGDKDQLSSVEAGSVLGDISDCGTEHGYTDSFRSALMRCSSQLTSLPYEHSSFANSTITLKKSYRFNDTSGIGYLSKAINNGSMQDVLSILNDSNQTECTFRSFASDTDFNVLMQKIITKNFRPLLKCTDTDQAFTLLDNFRILCAVRDGDYGVESINNHIMSQLTPGYRVSSSAIYAGLPVLVTANDYRMNVFNGDTGIVSRSEKTSNALMIAFKNQDSSIVYHHPGQIQHYEPSYAMTIHKSQGSEFDTVLVILPPQRLPICTRELLYTAVTRAKKRVEIWGTHDSLYACVHSRIIRSSGLRDKIWGDTNAP